jgi:hypothetical protein
MRKAGDSFSEREEALDVLRRALFESETRADPSPGDVDWVATDSATRNWYLNRIADLVCLPLELFRKAGAPEQM